MSIVVPQVLVRQQFQAAPVETVRSLRAFIFGPEFDLHRYAINGDNTVAGEYDPISGNIFAWLQDLGRRAGSTIDLDYTKVYVDNAVLRYYSESAPAQTQAASNAYGPAGDGTDAADGQLIKTLPSQRNKILVDGTNLANRAGFPLDAAFNGREVQAGDYFRASCVLDGDTYEAEGTIVAIEPEIVPGSIASATASPNNLPETAIITNVITPNTSLVDEGDIEVNSTFFVGVQFGVPIETYYITCTQATTGEDLSTGRFNITSASGTDNVFNYAPPATEFAETSAPSSTAFAVGTRNAFLVLTAISTPTGNQFQVGDTIEVTVSAQTGSFTLAEAGIAYIVPTVAAAGTYVGTENISYILTCTRGGVLGNATLDARPQITVTSTNGVDSAPAVTLPALVATPFNIGTLGVTATADSTAFSTKWMALGEQWIIHVTASGPNGGMRVIQLSRSLPVEVTSTSTNTYDLNLELGIKKNIELPQNIPSLVLENWTQDADAITIADGARAFDSSWLGGNTSLPLIAGDIIVHWRELVTTRSNGILEIAKLSDVAEVFDTPNHPDNPLVYAASKALVNSGSELFPATGIRVMAVPTNDMEGYERVLDLAELRDDVYTFVPLTYDPAIQSAVAQHVASMSNPETGLWRACILCPEEVSPSPVSTLNSLGQLLTATTDSNRFLTAPSGQFLTNGVRVGDKVRIRFTLDSVGNETYEEFTIDQVLSENTLRLTVAPSPTIVFALRTEVWRNLTSADVVSQISAKTAVLRSATNTPRRVISLFPSTIESGGEAVASYYLAAAIAGITGSAAPQQGLTNVEIRGFDNVKTVLDRFSKSQLDALANAGLWIVTQDLRTGSVYTRHQLTTDIDNLNTREFSIVKNVDSISYFFRSILARYIGRANNTQSARQVIETEVQAGIGQLLASNFNPLLGGQLLEDTEILEFRQHEVLRDRLVIVLRLDVPAPLNNIDLTLVI